MTDQPTGVFTASAEDYHADKLCEQPSLSASIAHLLYSRSPLHAWTKHPKLNPDYEREHNDRFDLGTVAHALFLEGRDLADAVVIVNAADWRGAAARDARDQARVEGKTALLGKDVERIANMLAALRQQLDKIDADPPLFADGRPEQTLIWQEEDGVTCRALVDWLRDDYTAIDDYKTTSATAEPDKWTRTMFTIGADIQAAFHLRGLKAVTGSDVFAEPVFRFVVQETYPPYAMSVVGLDPAVLEIANAKVDMAIKLWRLSMTSGHWPAYPTRVCYAELPAWEEARLLEREEHEKEVAA